MKYMLKSTDMKIPSQFAIFMKNKENKTTLLNLIGEVSVEDNQKPHGKVVCFSNKC